MIKMAVNLAKEVVGGGGGGGVVVGGLEMSLPLNLGYPDIILSAGCCPSYWVCDNMQTAAHDQVSP